MATIINRIIELTGWVVLGVSTVLLVFASHSNEFLARLCKTALWIDHGTIKMTGGIEEVVRAYEGEDAARTVREVLEETGLKVEKAAYLFSLPNTYLYSGFLVHTLDQFFLCTVEDTAHLEAMDDVADSFWMPLDKVNPEEFGLDSVREGVKRFLKEYKY